MCYPVTVLELKFPRRLKALIQAHKRSLSPCCDCLCSGPRPSCHSHTPDPTPDCHEEEPSETQVEGIMPLRIFHSSPLPRKEIPNSLAWHVMLSTALPWSTVPEASPATPTSPRHTAVKSSKPYCSPPRHERPLSVPLRIVIILHLVYLPDKPYLPF